MTEGYHRGDSFEIDVLKRLAQIERKVFLILKNGVSNMSEISDRMDALKAEVAETKGIQQSAAATINGLRDTINSMVANATDLEQLKADLSELTGELDASNTELSSSIATPSGPTPTPEA